MGHEVRAPLSLTSRGNYILDDKDGDLMRGVLVINKIRNIDKLLEPEKFSKEYSRLLVRSSSCYSSGAPPGERCGRTELLP